MKRMKLNYWVLGICLVAVLAACGTTNSPAPPAGEKAAAEPVARDIQPVAPASPGEPGPSPGGPPPQPGVTPTAGGPSADAAGASVTIAVYRLTAQGAQVRVGPDYPFRSGDKIRLALQSGQDGHLYLIQRGSSGKVAMLYPDRRIANGANTLSAGQELVIPATGWFQLDRTPGTETIYAYFATQPDAVMFQSMEAATGFSGKPPDPAVEAQVLSQLQQRAKARDIVMVPAPVPTSASSPAGSQPVPAAQPAAVGQPLPTSAAGPVLVTGSGSVAAVLQLKHE